MLDAQPSAAGVGGQAGGRVVEAKAHRVGFGVGEFALAAKGQQPQPGVQVGGEVRREAPIPPCRLAHQIGALNLAADTTSTLASLQASGTFLLPGRQLTQFR